MSINMVSKKVLAFMTIFGIIITLFFCAAVYFNTIYSKRIELNLEPTDEVLYCIDYVGQCTHSLTAEQVTNTKDDSWLVFKGNGKFERFIDVFGWAFIQGKEITLFDVDILLKEMNRTSNTYIKMATELVKRPELSSEYFTEDGCNYDNAGFLASISLDKLSMDEQYKVYIYYKNDGTDYLVETDSIIDPKLWGNK